MRLLSALLAGQCRLHCCSFLHRAALHQNSMQSRERFFPFSRVLRHLCDYYSNVHPQPCCVSRHPHDCPARVLLELLQQMRLLNIDQTLQGLLAANSHHEQQRQQQPTPAAAAAVRHRMENR
jgi:hypothetical protein